MCAMPGDRDKKHCSRPAVILHCFFRDLLDGVSDTIYEY